LRRKNIPYKIYGGLSFYERKEIKDILAYMRMVINPEDEEAFKRTINYPKRGLGDTSLQKILELAGNFNISAWKIISEPGNYTQHFNSGTVKKLSVFSELINALRINSDTMDAYTKAREIAMGSGIMKELREGKSPEEVSRYENLEELLNGIKVFTESAETNGEPSTLVAYLENVSLLTDQDNEKDEDRDKVTLMTMHSAKGLEFKVVYVAGMEDTLFPSPLSAGNPKELEEERRLFYVAVTRAEKLATLSYALNRYKWGNLERSNPSRFLREIDQEFLDYPQTGGKPFQRRNIFGSKPASIKEELHSYGPSGRFKKVRASENRTEVALNETDNGFSEGDTVQHERFGNGLIISIEGLPPNTTATVEFENDGTKKLLLRFARLKKT
jgi:DNA helicase-2/ATP-dependent DNA helicase PcrA